MNNKHHNIVLVILSIIVLLAITFFAAYSFFSIGNLNTTNITNLVATSERNNMVFDTQGGAMTLNVTAASMAPILSGNVAESNNTTLTVSFQSNTSYSSVCTYDIIYEWTSTDRYTAHTSGVTADEITIQASLARNARVNEGTNYIQSETDLTDVVGAQNSAIVVSGAQIDATGNVTSNAVWTLTTSFHNVDADQTNMSGKNYAGRFKVANVSCVTGTKLTTLVEFLTNDAPRSGTDAVSSSPWILTEDHTGEWRYAGKNPDNYVEFNGELWRIIGVMPNMEYCTGTYGTETECDTTTTGDLVKIIRNDKVISNNLIWDYKDTNVGSSTSVNGSNDWSDSQLMLMLNGTNYLKTGYAMNGTTPQKLHTSYTITGNIVRDSIPYNYYNATYSYLDGNGTTVYIPSQATTSSYTATSGSLYKKIESFALEQIATVKWYLYGTSSYSTAEEGSPEAWYNKERNIGNKGAIFVNSSLPEKRPVYWFGKIGLMYPSDYGYATNGGSTYNRSTCLGYQINGWSSGDYKTDCAGGSYLWFTNITSSQPGTSGTAQWTISPHSTTPGIVYYLQTNGVMGISVVKSNQGVIRPTLYLKSNILITGGSGTYNDPYTISSGTNNSSNTRNYWFASDGIHTFPSHGGTLQSSGSATGHNVYIGQDSSKYYVCVDDGNGHEACLSQPYTQYGLSGHTLNANLTSAEQASAKQALYQTLIAAGININIDNNCISTSEIAYCNIGNNRFCSVSQTGYISCADVTNYGCEVGYPDSAECSTFVQT